MKSLCDGIFGSVTRRRKSTDCLRPFSMHRLSRSMMHASLVFGLTLQAHPRTQCVRPRSKPAPLRCAPATVLQGSPDGKVLTSGHASGELHLFPMTVMTSSTLQAFRGPLVSSMGDLDHLTPHYVNQICRPKRVVLSSRGTLKHGFRVNCLDWYHDGGMLISGSADARLSFWDVEAMEVVRSLPCQGSPTAVSFNLNSPQVAYGGATGVLGVSDMRTGVTRANLSPLESMQQHERAVVLVGWLSDHSLVSAGTEGVVRIWDLRKGSHRGPSLASPLFGGMVKEAQLPASLRYGTKRQRLTAHISRALQVDTALYCYNPTTDVLHRFRLPHLYAESSDALRLGGRPSAGLTHHEGSVYLTRGSAIVEISPTGDHYSYDGSFDGAIHSIASTQLGLWTLGKANIAQCWNRDRSYLEMLGEAQ